MDQHRYRLPEEFAYLRGVVVHFTRDSCREIDDAREMALRLNAEELGELATAYRAIISHDHVQRLSAFANEQHDDWWKLWKRWCELSSSYEDKGLEPPLEQEPADRPRLMQLFYMFDKLAKKKVPPFDTREVEYSPPPVRMDWSKLPPRLSYLQDPAMRYGHLQFQEDRDRFSCRMTSGQHAELAALAKRLRSNGDEKLAIEWTGEYSISEHPEANRIFWLMAVLNDIVPERKDTVSPNLDWNKLPWDLRDISSYAEKYGVSNSPDARARLIEQLHAEREADKKYSRHALLANFAMLFKPSNRLLAQQWLERFPPEGHRSRMAGEKRGWVEPIGQRCLVERSSCGDTSIRWEGALRPPSSHTTGRNPRTRRFRHRFGSASRVSEFI